MAEGLGNIVSNPQTGVRFSNSLRGGSFVSAQGIDFTFEPSIGFGASQLYKLSNKLKSFREPLEFAVREVIRPSIAENFAVGGRPSWTPLALSTIARKQSDKKLIETGKLSKVAAQRNIWTITSKTATIDGGALLSRVPYALYMQAGTFSEGVAEAKDNRGRNVFQLYNAGSPPRPYLMIQPEDKIKVQQIFLKWLDVKIAQTWGAGK